MEDGTPGTRSAVRSDLTAPSSKAANWSAHTTCRAPPCAPNPNAGRGRGAARAGGEGGRAAAPPAAAAPAPPPPAPSTIKWVGTRQPVWPSSNTNGFHTYGKPVVVVGAGVGKEAWSGDTPETWQTECVNRWTYENGTMENAVPAQGERPTCNIYTKEKFKDFKVEAELLLDQGQNSGFYLRGRYELQLQVGGARSAAPRRAARAWARSTAGRPPTSTPASRPANGRSSKPSSSATASSAWFNDIRIHDNAELPAFTGGALDNDELAPGPIMIQGDHSLVTFRKLVVTPITKAGQ